jgi:hypothetical protein
MPEGFLSIMPPNTNTMMTGVSSISFVSGARKRERKLASAIAEECSDKPGMLFSRNRAGIAGKLDGN